jgi:hypothetical protein
MSWQLDRWGLGIADPGLTVDAVPARAGALVVTEAALLAPATDFADFLMRIARQHGALERLILVVVRVIAGFVFHEGFST